MERWEWFGASVNLFKFIWEKMWLSKLHVHHTDIDIGIIVISNNLIILTNCYYILCIHQKANVVSLLSLSLKQKNNAILNDKNNDFTCQNRFISWVSDSLCSMIFTRNNHLFFFLFFFVREEDRKHISTYTHKPPIQMMLGATTFQN